MEAMTSRPDTSISLQRYGVGNRQMVEHADGSYIMVKDLLRVIDWLTDDDEVQVMLTKLDFLREAIS